MTDLDVPAGRLYLGEGLDAATRRRNGEAVLLEAADLTTHGVLVGMTGSGPTGLGVVMLEEALLAGVLVLDPKGDLGNLLLTFPDLAAADAAPEDTADEVEGFVSGRVDPGGGARRATQRPVDGPRGRHGGRRRRAQPRGGPAAGDGEEPRRGPPGRRRGARADLAEELAAIDAKAGEDAAAIEAVDVPLEKTDVRVTALSVVWVPVA